MKKNSLAHQRGVVAHVGDRISLPVLAMRRKIVFNFKNIFFCQIRCRFDSQEVVVLWRYDQEGFVRRHRRLLGAPGFAAGEALKKREEGISSFFNLKNIL